MAEQTRRDLVLRRDSGGELLLGRIGTRRVDQPQVPPLALPPARQEPVVPGSDGGRSPPVGGGHLADGRPGVAQGGPEVDPVEWVACRPILERAELDEGRIEVHRRGEPVARARYGHARRADHHRAVERSVEERVLAPDARLAQMEAVVGPQHDDGRLREAGLFEGVEDATDLAIGEARAGGVGPARLLLACGARRGEPLPPGRVVAAELPAAVEVGVFTLVADGAVARPSFASRSCSGATQGRCGLKKPTARKNRSPVAENRSIRSQAASAISSSGRGSGRGPRRRRGARSSSRPRGGRRPDRRRTRPSRGPTGRRGEEIVPGVRQLVATIARSVVGVHAAVRRVGDLPDAGRRQAVPAHELGERPSAAGRVDGQPRRAAV